MPAFTAVSGSPRLGRLAIVGLIVLPLLIGGLLAWALAAPTANLDRVTAAIVNDDVPVTIDGQTVPLGRELAASLMASEEPPPPGEESTATPSFDWVLTNDDEAAAGLAAGRYVAVVTIPAAFSADATSITGTGAEARQAVVGVETTPASAWLDPALTGAVSQAAAAALGRELTSRYLTQIYDGFNEIAAQIGAAADGADQLAVGAASTAEGAAALATGADELSAGATVLDAGAATLASGLADLDATAQPLPDRTRQLARAANEVARTVGEATRRMDAATAAFAVVVDDLCTSPGPACDRATQALERLEAADDSLRTLAEGTRRVAAGNDALAVIMPRLVDGIDSASSGATQVASGAASTDTGAAALATGAGELSTGAAELDDGAAQLASGLDEASAQLPTYSDADIVTLSTVVAEPVVADTAVQGTGLQSVPLFTMIALWIGALVTAIAVQAVPTRRLLSGTSSLRIAAGAIVPTMLLGAAQGAVVGIAVLTTVTVTPWEWIAYVAASALTGAMFGVVNLGLAAAFGSVGRIIAALIGIVALAAGLSSTVPPVIAAVAGAMPTAAATALLRAALTGDAAGVPAALFGFAFAAIVGFALVLAGVAARRKVTAVVDA